MIVPLNLSNLTNFDNHTLQTCEHSQDFEDFSTLFFCFKYFYVKRLLVGIFGSILIVGILMANFGLIIHKVVRKGLNLTIYDQIIIGHCIVDGLTGLIDVPLFWISYLFGYWPFGKGLSLYWASYDNNINTTTALHMLYMEYVTIRNIKSPIDYKNELLIRKPYIVMACIWGIGLTTWIPITLYYGTKDFTLSVEFNPYLLQTIFNFFSWFLIDIGILVLSIYMSILLYERSKKARVSSTELPSLMGNAIFPGKKFDIASLIRFLFSFILQWITPCLLILLDPVCLCISDELNDIVYWMTFTVCFTDPVLLHLCYRP